MASNDEYQQRQFFEESWYNKTVKELRKKYFEEMERLVYTAQEGSLLDRIWKGEKINKN
jgi:hypothetical protein